MLEIARRPWLRRSVIRYLARNPALFSDLLGIAAADSRTRPESPLGVTLAWALTRAGLLG
jgi:hypothetical protein